MNASKFIFSALLFAGIFLCGGCEIFREALQESYTSEDPTSDDFETKFNIGVFQVVKYPRATMLEKEIVTPDGENIYINVNALFSSKRIRQARAIPRPGNPDVYDLELRIDRMGKTQWMMMEPNKHKDKMIMMVDNRYVGVFYPESYVDGKQDWVKVQIGVDAYTAKGIVKFATKNYEFYNPEAKNWFDNLFQ